MFSFLSVIYMWNWQGYFRFLCFKCINSIHRLFCRSLSISEFSAQVWHENFQSGSIKILQINRSMIILKYNNKVIFPPSFFQVLHFLRTFSSNFHQWNGMEERNTNSTNFDRGLIINSCLHASEHISPNLLLCILIFIIYNFFSMLLKAMSWFTILSFPIHCLKVSAYVVLTSVKSWD